MDNENPMFKKLIEKKKKEGKTLSPIHQEAKDTVLSDLMDHLSGMGLDKINGMKKVTVAAPDKSGLKAGLEQASNMVDKKGLGAMEDSETSDFGANDDEVEGSDDSDLAAHEEHDEENADDLKAKIAELEAKIASMKG